MNFCPVQISDKDAAILEHLIDIRDEQIKAKDGEVQSGFKLVFQFAPQEYFSNTELVTTHPSVNVLFVVRGIFFCRFDTGRQGFAVNCWRPHWQLMLSRLLRLGLYPAAPEFVGQPGFIEQYRLCC